MAPCVALASASTSESESERMELEQLYDAPPRHSLRTSLAILLPQQPSAGDPRPLPAKRNTSKGKKTASGGESEVSKNAGVKLQLCSTLQND